MNEATCGAYRPGWGAGIGRNRLPCVLAPHDGGDHKNAFNETWSDPTVTLPTLDHGDVTIPEPSWCAGHDEHVPVHRVDLTHFGPEHALTFDGEDLYALMLAQSPFTMIASRSTRLYVEQTGYARSLAPGDLDALAAAFIEHAAHLRHRARELAVLLDGGER